MYLQFLQDPFSENAPEVISESKINIFLREHASRAP